MARNFMIVCYMITSMYAKAQPTLASAQLKTMRGPIVSFSSATQKDSLILVCFWATTSDMSITELNAINAKYEKWEKSFPFKMMAIAIDEGKDANRVRGLVNMNDWRFDVYTDVRGDLRAALNSNNLPQAVIIKNNKVIYQQSGYETGTEDYLFEKLKIIAREK